ncbi:MAG: peptidylprolyl isomerase [Coriobacteriia bacterium]|nr:peptidylprolyl isomerase [Coriobacteriia bacterium]
MPLQDGDTILVHYTGLLSDGTRFESTEKQEPLQFTLGASQVLPAFEKAVRALDIGEGTVAHIPVNEAYGPRDENKVQKYPRDIFPDEPVPQPGWVVEMGNDDGLAMPATIIEIDDDGYTLDYNHPLAGEDLTYEIEVISYGATIDPEAKAKIIAEAKTAGNGTDKPQ